MKWETRNKTSKAWADKQAEKMARARETQQMLNAVRMTGLGCGFGGVDWGSQPSFTLRVTLPLALEHTAQSTVVDTNGIPVP